MKISEEQVCLRWSSYDVFSAKQLGKELIPPKDCTITAKPSRMSHPLPNRGWHWRLGPVLEGLDVATSNLSNDGVGDEGARRYTRCDKALQREPSLDALAVPLDLALAVLAHGASLDLAVVVRHGLLLGCHV
jgi:hypothetical protein